MLAFWSSQFAQELSNFLGGPVQTLEGLSGLSFLALAYRHTVCSQHRCYRLGRFQHGHLRLCHRHHPAVPDHGRITREHIDEITRRTDG